MKEEKDFFYKASGIFLTENLTLREFDDILSKGDILPVCSDYENWDKDYLEERILEVADELEMSYNQGISSSDSLSKFMKSFIVVAKQVSSKCALRRDLYRLGFSKLLNRVNDQIGGIYFADDYETWSVEVNDIEYMSYSGKIKFPENTDFLSMKKALDILSDFNDKFKEKGDPLRREFPSI